MRRFVIPVLMAAMTVAGAAAAGDGDAILGLWATDPEGGGGEAHVDVRMVDGKYVGTIIWLAEAVYQPGDPSGPEGEPKTDTNILT